jgi:hypothetical protein
MEKILKRCNVCANLTDRFCEVKKCTLKPNNKRKCEHFELDETKIKTKQYIPTIDMTGGYAFEQKRLRKQAREYLAQREASTNNVEEATLPPDCLAKFRSTAASEE